MKNIWINRRVFRRCGVILKGSAISLEVSGLFKVIPPKSRIMTVTLLCFLGIKWGKEGLKKKKSTVRIVLKS